MEEGGEEGVRGEKGEEDWVADQVGGMEEGHRAGMEAVAGSVAAGTVAWEAGEEAGWVASMGGEAGWVAEVEAEGFAPEVGAERHLLPLIVDLHTYSK